MILIDTGPIVALINDRDNHHQECRYLLERLPSPLLIPATVATEVCLLLERRRGIRAELAFLTDISTGRYALIESLTADLDRVAELVAKYDNLPLVSRNWLGFTSGPASTRREPAYRQLRAL